MTATTHLTVEQRAEPEAMINSTRLSASVATRARIVLWHDENRLRKDITGWPGCPAQRQHTFEPDPPAYTSRIWAARQVGDPEDCLIGYARRSSRGDGDVDRMAWLVGTLTPGTRILMTTYDGTIGTVRATPAPHDVRVDSETINSLLPEVWSALDPHLRMAAFAFDAHDERAATLTIR